MIWPYTNVWVHVSLLMGWLCMRLGVDRFQETGPSSRMSSFDLWCASWKISVESLSAPVGHVILALMWVLEEAVDRSWRGRLNEIEGGNYRKEKKLCSMFGRTSFWQKTCCVETLSGRKSTTKWLSNDSLMDKGRVKFGISYVFISDTTRQKYGIASMSSECSILKQGCPTYGSRTAG